MSYFVAVVYFLTALGVALELDGWHEEPLGAFCVTLVWPVALGIVIASLSNSVRAQKRGSKPISEVVQLLACAASRSGAEERLVKYVKHLEGCGRNDPFDTFHLSCSCGLESLLADLAGGNK